MSLEEQIISKDKYESSVSSQMGAIAFLILFTTGAFLNRNMGNIARIFLSFSWATFGHVACLYGL